MAVNVIPPVETKGSYILKPPFAGLMKPNTLYTLVADRTFSEIESFGQNIFTIYYNPFQLTEADVQRDRAAGERIITLMNPDNPPLYVPTSYVERYPDLNYRPYNQYICVLSFGPMAEDTMFEPVIQALKNTTSEFLGVEPEVHIAYMPLSDVITPTQHANLEANRQAAISNRETDYARLYQANATIAQLNQRIAILEKIVIDNDLLP